MPPYLVGSVGMETTQTSGTGAYSLAGVAGSGLQTLKAALIAATGQQIGPWRGRFYVKGDDADPGWEEFWGTLTDATPDTVSRDQIRASSNGGNAVSWGSGVKTIFLMADSDAVNRAIRGPGGDQERDATIAAGKLDVVTHAHKVLPESGSSDVLQFLSDALPVGSIVSLRCSPNNVITLEDNTASPPAGYLPMQLRDASADVGMHGGNDVLTFLRRSTEWTEIGRQLRWMGVHLKLTSHQSVSNSPAYQDVVWDAAVEQRGSWWTSGATITVLEGVTRIGIEVQLTWGFGEGNGSYRELQLLKNGSAFDGRPGDRWSDDSGSQPFTTVSGEIPVAGGDTIKVQARNTSANPHDIKASTDTYLRIYRVDR